MVSYETLASLSAHVLAFVTAYNFAKHLKALRWRTPFQAICDAWTRDPAPFKINPHHLIPGPHSLGRRRERGQDGQARGRQWGGSSTKIHLKVDLDGRPLAFHLTEGQASDSPQFEVLLDLGPDITPRAAVGDKGYDSKANRSAARERNICPVIPFKASAQNRP